MLEEVDRVAALLGYQKLLLDCYQGDGFLPSYYDSRGWESIEEKTVAIAPTERKIRAVLMEKLL